MAYLFISFAEHLIKESLTRGDIYYRDLNTQYHFLKKKIPGDRRIESFIEFMRKCFPSGYLKYYHISCPNFLREVRESSSDRPSYLNNVVIRPELTLNMRHFLPDGQNIILIGDLCFSQNARTFNVKGVEFIDETISSPNDKTVRIAACLRFERNTWEISGVNPNDTYFTPDHIVDLIETCYTVSNPAEIRKTYEEWNKYIEFRKYYLEEQAKRNFKLDSSTFIQAYAINKKEYRKNSYAYDDYILDGINDFKKGDMVVLSEKIENAEPFPLVRLTIERNKKAFENAEVMKRGKKVNEEERRIRSLASDNVFVTSLDPSGVSKLKNFKQEERPITIGEMLTAGYALGDRFRIVSSYIEPTEHLKQLEIERDKDIEYAVDEIDASYSRLIEKELEQEKMEYLKRESDSIASTLHAKSKDLDALLDKDCRENTDKSVHKRIDDAVEGIRVRAKLENKKFDREDWKDYNERIESIVARESKNIDIRKFYDERNQKIIENARQSQFKELERKVKDYEKSKLLELKNKYADEIREKKIKAKEEAEKACQQSKKKAIEEETIIRFSLYFRLGDANNIINDKQIAIINRCEYIVYDSRAERAKINRQEMSLKNFYSGFVKNPYLSTYLFNSESLPEITPEHSDWTWYLETLNDKQKEAVRKAVSSNGIFLLQGPPGTGKTQVIAETVAQMVKKGKKVLISSETHKAIDNVFDRLPKIADIVPIRLIASNRKKDDNDYDPKFLVDNFYSNISANMLKAVDRYQNFEKNKEDFKEKLSKLKLLKSKIDKSKEIIVRSEQQIAELDKQAKELSKEKSSLNDKKEAVLIKLDSLNRTGRHIENGNLRLEEDIEENIIIDLIKEIRPLFEVETFASDDLEDILHHINNLTGRELEKELSLIDPESNKVRLELQKAEIKKQIAAVVDEAGYPLPGKEEEEKSLRSKLREIINLQKESSDSTISELNVSKIYNHKYLVENLDNIQEEFESLKMRISDAKAKYITIITEKKYVENDKLKTIDEQLEKISNKTKEINDKIYEIQDSDAVKDVKEDSQKLERNIGAFFKDFEIAEPYTSIENALEIIENQWNKLENDFESAKKENEAKIPMYRKISQYLQKEEVIDADRKLFTRGLFENANVFGITCTSGDRFNSKNIGALNEYNIDDFDLRSVGVDVVIIDEVSKSSFIDLLIPILYGKTVILVGDHRQLPPMYEFAKLRDDDFEGLDERIINKEINKKFTSMYEECIFKSLFEKVPDSYKTMLVQQYRCHEHIMNVFNHFYQGQLKLGFIGQNNAKHHNANIYSNGRNIISPDKHIYFVDCKQNETHEMDSTSMYNTGEARVVAELINKLNTFYRKNPQSEKLSIGVISTYGDQARRVKEVMREERVKTDAFNNDTEKMIVSTVDDFQGDERDIIILTMVRNPEDPAKSNPGFILAYQRINVALSRARRMLIVVGNRKYLENKGVIDLPNVNGDGRVRKNFMVYQEIISTIEQHGRVFDDVDVLEKKEEMING